VRAGAVAREAYVLWARRDLTARGAPPVRIEDRARYVVIGCKLAWAFEETDPPSPGLGG
jgi:hypothetical protein